MENLKSLKSDNGVAAIARLLNFTFPGSDLSHLNDTASPDQVVTNGSKVNLPGLMRAFNDVKGMMGDSRFNSVESLSEVTGLQPDVLAMPLDSDSGLNLGALIRVILGFAAYTFNFRKIQILLSSLSMLKGTTNVSKISDTVIQTFFSLVSESLPPEITEVISGILSSQSKSQTN